MTITLDQLERTLAQPTPEPIPGQLVIPDGPRIGSLCTGYGGLDLAVHGVLGGSLAWVADLDDGPRKILAHHWPNVPNLGDLTAVDWSTVEPVDVLVAGYPCQPFSVAGNRKGTADARHIWPHIAAAIRVLRPGLCFFENVAGHVRLGLDAVLADLAALGFDAEWVVVRASDVGAPHQRARVFLLAIAQDTDRPTRGEWRIAAPGQAEGGRTRPDARGRGRAPVADAARDRHRHTGPARVGRIPAAPAVSGATTLPDAEHGREPERARSSRREEGERAPVGSVTRCSGEEPAWGDYAPAVARWEAATGHRAPWATDARGRLAPEFVEWLMGLAPGWVTAVPGLSRTQQLKALGNGVVPAQAAYALRLLLDRAGLAHLFRVTA